MDADRKQRIARATADLLRAVREQHRARERARARSCRDLQRALIVEDPPPPAFAQAVKAFAEAIAS